MSRKNITKHLGDVLHQIKPIDLIVILLSNGILAFGLYNIHAQADITEGGILGFILLLEQWFGLSPAYTELVLNFICYGVAWKLLGSLCIFYSFAAMIGFSIAYRLAESFGPIYPQIAEMPLVASIMGAIVVGVTVGICVRLGCAPGGDDALALCTSHVFRIEIQWAYMTFDFTVLLLSLSYIPLRKILYSMVTVVLSGQIIGWFQRRNIVNK